MYVCECECVSVRLLTHTGSNSAVAPAVASVVLMFTHTGHTGHAGAQMVRKRLRQNQTLTLPLITSYLRQPHHLGQLTPKLLEHKRVLAGRSELLT